MKNWLMGLEAETSGIDLKDVVLWPGSVARDMQPAIINMYGTGDLDDSPDARPVKIVDYLSRLGLDRKFSVLDICCGDGLVLYRIKWAFREANCYGVDINKDGISTLTVLGDFGVSVYRIPMQRLFESVPPAKIDVTMMLNTYRGWSAAQLRAQEYDLPNAADRWMSAYSKYSILTAQAGQVARLAERHTVTVMGRGEQESQMILVEWHG